MPKSLLDAVNETLKRVGVIAGDAGALTSLTNSARQRAIDIAVQSVNEGIDDLYSKSDKPHPMEQAQSTITLSTGIRAYALAADIVQMRWPLVDKTNSQLIVEFPGGYNAILLHDLEQDDTGLPLAAAIRPTDKLLHLDRAPTAADNGRVYTYQYDKDLVLTVAASTVPFGDAVFRAMVPAWVQLWKREMRNEFDDGLWSASVGRASRFMTMKQQRSSYNPR